jgi:hypothetical protein
MVHFETKNTHLGKFWGGLKMENVIFYGRSEHLTSIWYTYLYGNLVCNLMVLLMVLFIFSPVLVYCFTKNLATQIGCVRVCSYSTVIGF